MPEQEENIELVGARMLRSTIYRKAAMVKALKKTLGIVTSACKLAHVARRTHYHWYTEDPEYAAQVDDIGEIALDFGESQLHKNMLALKEASIIFFLKTKGKHRGYIERVEVDDGSEAPRRFNLQVMADDEDEKIDPPLQVGS